MNVFLSRGQRFKSQNTQAANRTGNRTISQLTAEYHFNRQENHTDRLHQQILQQTQLPPTILEVLLNRCPRLVHGGVQCVLTTFDQAENDGILHQNETPPDVREFQRRRCLRYRRIRFDPIPTKGRPGRNKRLKRRPWPRHSQSRTRDEFVAKMVAGIDREHESSASK